MIVIYNSGGVLTENCLYYDSRVVNYNCSILYKIDQNDPPRIRECSLSRETENNESGPWCGQVVRMLAFYSDDPSSNPAEDYSFSCKFCA